MRALISTSLNLPKYYQERNEPFAIEVVAYNAGVHMLRADTSPVKDLLRVVRGLTPEHPLRGLRKPPSSAWSAPRAIRSCCSTMSTWCRTAPDASSNCRKPAGPTSGRERRSIPASGDLVADFCSRPDTPRRRRRHDRRRCRHWRSPAAGSAPPPGPAAVRHACGISSRWSKAPVRSRGWAILARPPAARSISPRSRAGWCCWNFGPPGARRAGPALPMLDRLAAGGRSDLAVVAVSTDRNRALVAPYRQAAQAPPSRDRLRSRRSRSPASAPPRSIPRSRSTACRSRS